MDSKQIDEFLAKVYASDDSNTDETLDLMYDTIDDLLGGQWEKSFNDGMQELGGPRVFPEPETAEPNLEVIQAILERADVSQMNITLMLGFLCTTNCLRPYPPREAYGKRAKKEIKKRGRNPKTLLGGLLD